MNLQGRNLSIEMQGDDVGLLQGELRRLGFDVPEAESQQAYFGPGTREAVLGFQERNQLEPTGVVDEGTAALINAQLEAQRPMVVRGQVSWPDGSPFVGGLVRAYDRQLRDSIFLGEAPIDRTGRYRIVYSVEPLRQYGKEVPDLSVRAFDRVERLLGVSPIVFEARPDATVDLTVEMLEEEGTSEYERLDARILPLTAGVSPSDLTESDAAFLAAKIGIDVESIEYFIQAAQLGEQTGLPSEVLYGLLSHKLPEEPGSLFTQSQETLRSALEASVRDGVVPASVGDDLGAISERLQQLGVEYALQRREDDGGASLDDLLSTVLDSDAERQAFAARLLRHHRPSSEFWDELREDPRFDERLVEDLRFTVEAGELTGNHVPLVRELQQMRTERKIGSPRELAGLTEQEWREMCSKEVDGEVVGFPANLPGDTFEEKARNMVRAMETAFPTAAFAYRLRRDATDGLPFTAIEKQDLTSFILNNPGFELGGTVVDRYVEENRETALREVVDGPALREQLKRVQRVFKLAPRYDETLPLLAAGLDSARSIVRAGKDAFVNKYSDALGDRARAEATFEKAGQASATALMLFSRHNRAFNFVDLAVTKKILADGQGSAAVLDELTNQIPDLKTLFGSLDLCDCEHCRSVYSPAAYLVDILQFLERRPSKTDGKTALDVLLDPRRRADIGTTELSCENTNTPVPYVDLVNEILEDAVAPPPVPIGHWKFDEGQGSTTADSSANGNAGTLLGQSGGKPSWEEGKVGRGCLSFDGTDDYVRVGATPELAFTNEGSISAWIHPKGTGGVSSKRGTIIAKEGEYVVSWALYPGGGAIDWRLSNMAQWHAAGGFIAPVSQWTHIAIVFDDGRVKTYANGQLVDDASGSIGPASAQPKEITIGGRPSLAVSEYFYGLIDDVRVYDRALSAKEVLKSMSDLTGRQTRGTQEELAAHPEHSNTQAYDRLASTVYPWSLPHDRWVEEARAYLEQLGVHREELMAAFRKKGNLAAPTSIATVGEHLGLTTAERKIITDAPINPPSPWYFWGYEAATVSGKGWVDALSKAPEFLRRSGLEYGELVELLDTRFVNPNGIIALNRGGTGCKLEDVTITNLDEAALVRILRFLRLRRRLGWTIRELDRTVAALQPKGPSGSPHLTKDFLRQVSHAKRLQARLDVPLLAVLSWWAPMDTVEYETEGLPETPSLYRQVFLNKAVTNPPNAAFELGALAAGTAKIGDFVAPISAALQIGASDLALLTVEELNDDDLNLTNLSHLYRVATFSKALGLTLREFLSVKAMTGIHPVRPAQVTGPVQTHETLDTLRFVELVEKIRASGLGVAQLDYLLRHEEHPPARIAPAEEQIVTVLREIGDGLRKIEAETAVAPDPTGELLRKMMTFAAPTIGWGEADVDRAVRMLEGSAIYAAPLDALPTITLPEPLKSKVSYDPVAEELRFVGPMTTAEKTQLLALSNDQDYRSAVEALFQEPRSFVSGKMAGFLDPTDATTRLLDQTSMSALETFDYVLMRLSARLRRVLGENLVKQKLGEALKLKPALADSLLTGLLRSTTYASRPLVEDFLAFAGNGLSATYYDNANLTGATVSRVDPAIDFNWGTSGSPDPAITGTFSVRWIAKLLAPRTDTYTFYARTDGGVRLRVGGQQLVDEWNHSPGITEHEAKVTLQAGRLYDVEMEYSKSGASATAELRWAGSTAQKEIVPQSSLYPGDAFAAFARLHKAALLIDALGLTTQELAYVHAHKEDFADFDLNVLPLEASGASHHLLDRLERLYDLASLKKSTPRGGAGLLELFGTAAASEDPNDPKLSDDVADKLALTTGWTADETGDLIAAFEFTDRDFKNEAVVLRLRTCVNLSRRLGVSTGRLREWAVLNPDETRAREIKDALKAKYGDEQWLTVAGPLSDTLRGERRSALVDYLLARPAAIGRSRLRNRGELFEHFLVDVEMSPCQATSRIKLAIGSVQLFVQRCLMNLEPEVSLTPQDAAEWKWTKSYRVWEANRKVFLYPENWVEPGVRDDKTPFFKDLENELLQNEVTADTAESALLRYLEKLDAVARLEICGMYHQIERNDRFDVTGDVLHVFGRTMADPRVHYYRRRVNSSYWTAWEKVETDIMGDHLIPVVHNRRLYLFWPILTEKAEEQPQLTGTASLPKKFWEIQLAWSEYKNKRWSPKLVSPDVLRQPVLLRSYEKDYRDAERLSRQRLSRLFATGTVGSMGSIDEGLFIVWYRSYDYAAYAHVLGWFQAGAGERVPRPVGSGAGTEYQLPWSGGSRPENMMLVNSGPLDAVDIDPEIAKYDQRILGTPPGKFRVLYPHQFYSDGVSHSGRFDFVDQSGTWVIVTPLFFQDDRKTFFLTQEKRYSLGSTGPTFYYYFDTFYHPHVRVFIEALNARGIDGLLRREVQLSRNDDFLAHYAPTNAVNTGYPVEDVTFDYREAYAQYNWELFFHAPLMIADQLSKNQRFEEAQKWFHYIFDPTVGPTRGLSATYYDNANLTGATVSRVDPTIDFDWGTRSPDPAIGSDTFSVQWTGKVQPEYTETYTFYTRTDDGVRLWVDNKLIVDQWKDQPATEYSGTVALEAGRLYDLKMQYYENGGAASARLSWESPSTPKAVVPQSRLYPDPSVTPDSPARYWQVRPFFEEEIGKPIEELMRLLATKDSELDGGLLAGKRELESQVRRWRENPFNPHLIARLRRTPYQRAVVMKYLDNLIAWGDQLFRRDTIESINEATQLYVLAAAILGERPVALPEQPHASYTFNELRGTLDAFSNALVRIENLVPAPETNGQAVAGGASGMATLNNLTLYFGIPRNENLLRYWDTVEDRLFKIRHCQNIEGVERQLPLFEPPIDPGLLVKASAAGLDISSVLSDVNAAQPHYRFATMAQKATELCADVKSLGAALLSALEKRDAEGLALLRSGHEVQVLNAVRQVKERQIEEASQALEGLRKSKEVNEARRDYYRDIVQINANEKLHMDELGAAHNFNEIAQGLSVGVSLSHMMPDFHVGAAGISSPYAVAKWGGTNLGPALQAAAGVMGMIAAQHTHDATMASIKGSYDRRWDDWKQQEKLANKELDQIDKQILAAEIRLAIAEKDLENHDLQVENTREADAYMRGKYTNQELYDWMTSQISTIYFQSYQQAYDGAKRAERAYQFELGLQDSSFIRFGYWDSLKKGLLAGERLHHDLKRMEVAYLDQNKREYELTKHISLAMLDPIKLVELRETGECYVELPEVVFDLDNPGHYMRRIKSVGLSIPCVTGPYTSVNCKLTLLRSSVRKNASTQVGYARKQGEDIRFTDSIGAIQSVVTSSAREDHGVFEPSLRDERYQPFEGAGAISSWRIELDKDCNGFDFDTISDVVLHMAYTAREGGESLKKAAKVQLPQAGLQMFTAKHEFPSEWHRFLHPTNTDAKQTLQLKLVPERFPFQAKEKTIEIQQVDLFMKLSSEEVEKKYRGEGTGNVTSPPLTVYLRAPGASSAKDAKLESDDDFLSGVAYATVGVTHKAKSTDPPWEIEARSVDIEKINDDLHDSTTVGGTTVYRLKPDVVEDLLVVCHYSVVQST